MAGVRLDWRNATRKPRSVSTPRHARAVRGETDISAAITPDRPLEPGINRFEVRVSEAGDTWIERLQW